MSNEEVLEVAAVRVEDVRLAAVGAQLSRHGLDIGSDLLERRTDDRMSFAIGAAPIDVAGESSEGLGWVGSARDPEGDGAGCTSRVGNGEARTGGSSGKEGGSKVRALRLAVYRDISAMKHKTNMQPDDSPLTMTRLWYTSVSSNRYAARTRTLSLDSFVFEGTRPC